MLRQPGKYCLSALGAYDRLLIQHGTAITLSRARLFEKINDGLLGLSPAFITGGPGPLSTRYYSNLLRAAAVTVTNDELSQHFAQAMAKGLTRDREEGATCYGPHRDTFSFVLAGKDLAEYGSEGECRTACLLLRLASLQVIQSRLSRRKPVVLLVDDVLGELDKQRRGALFEMILQSDQILLAGTELPPELGPRAAVTYHVAAGTVTPR